MPAMVKLDLMHGARKSHRKISGQTTSVAGVWGWFTAKVGPLIFAPQKISPDRHNLRIVGGAMGDGHSIFVKLGGESAAANQR